MKNRAALPRTAGLRTLSELTSEMTKAGLDPSRIQERAEILAKVAGAKRKRQDATEMDLDDEMDGAVEDDEEWMDVDEDVAPKLKRVKTNTGVATTKGGRHPSKNRQLAGLRDEAVGLTFLWIMCIAHTQLRLLTAIIEGHKATKSRSEGAQYARASGRVGPRNQNKTGMSQLSFYCVKIFTMFDSRSISSLANGRWVRLIDGSCCVLGPW